MNWKLIVLGGLAFYLVTFVVSFVTGPVIHNGILKETYRQSAELWRPALMQDPPDMAALMPRWITSGVIGGLLMAAIYGWVRPAFSGPGWKRGLLYGTILSLFGIAWCLGYSGVFNAPDKIWAWWALESFLYYLPAGAVLGWLAEKLVPQPTYQPAT